MDHRLARSLLGVNQTSSDDDIKKAYRQMAMKYHPDRDGGNEAKFKEIKEAYEFLLNNKDVKEKASYEWANESKARQSKEGFTRGSRPKLDDLDEDGWMNGKSDWASYIRRKENEKSGRKEEIVFVELTLAEAFTGKMVQTDVENGDSISGQRYAFQVQPGVVDKEHLKTLIVPNRKTYKFIAKIISDYEINWGTTDPQQAGDILMDIEISPFLMMTGGTINVQTIENTLIEVTIPKGLRSNKILRIKGFGYWRNKILASRGDCFLRIIPDIKPIEQYDKRELANLANNLKNMGYT